MPRDDTLPIRRLTLYKHGVCFVQRQGTVTAEEIRLTVGVGELNDALKSLLVVDRRGGQIQGIHYDTPADRQTRLAGIPIALSADHSLLDLIRSLRGYQVRLVTGEGTESQEYSGRLLGVELLNDKAPLGELLVMLLDDASDTARSLPLRDIRQIGIQEERGNRDLRFFLDASREEDAHRSVTVRLEPGEHDLTISYLVPSPTWRISYRLAAERETPEGDDSAASQAQSSGTLLLQGWGLFDNRLEEDLEGVEVTLVAGQPISFIYDLAASTIPNRPVVAEQGRIATGPVEFEAAMVQAPAAAAFQESYDAPGSGRQRMVRAARGAPAPMQAAAPATIDSLASGMVAAAGSEQGELFAYRVAAPVTAKRGSSALVPIINERLPYRRELLFNERKLARHPVAALRFANGTGLVLERGPVTVLEDGDYRGEALVPFTKEGGEVYLAFAVELGIKVTRVESTSEETAGIHIADALLNVKHALVTRTSYRLESSLPELQAVTIEHPLDTNSELVDTPEPDAGTADYYRWNVACQPRQATTFVVTQRRYIWRSSQLLDQSYASLQAYLKQNWLDGTVLERIKALLDERKAISRNESEISKLQGERQELYEREEQLRKNMAALSSTGEEGALRRTMVMQLQASESRLDAIEARIEALKEENNRRQGVIDGELRAIRVD